MNELEKMRLELVELKIDNLLLNQSEYADWNKRTIDENAEKIKKLEKDIKIFSRDKTYEDE